MNDLHEIFNKKAVDFCKLKQFGFCKNNNNEYVYTAVLQDSGFNMTVCVSDLGAVTADVTDPVLGEPYTLYLSDTAEGAFVGGVKAEYEAVLRKIADICFSPDVFKSAQAKSIINYVCKKYGNEPEYLWKKVPSNAVIRRSDTRKWYAVLLTVPANRLGKKSDEIIEIINLHMEPQKLSSLLDGKLYYPGWHMNKKGWVSVILDGSVLTDEILQRIDESYALAKK